MFAPRISLRGLALARSRHSEMRSSKTANRKKLNGVRSPVVPRRGAMGIPRRVLRRAMPMAWVRRFSSSRASDEDRQSESDLEKDAEKLKSKLDSEEIDENDTKGEQIGTGLHRPFPHSAEKEAFHGVVKTDPKGTRDRLVKRLERVKEYEEKKKKERETHDSYGIPLWMGFGVLALFAFVHMLDRFRYMRRQDELENGPRRYKPFSDKTIERLKYLPTRAVSRAWGWVTSIWIPPPLREPIIGIYARKFNCRLEDMNADSLREFSTLGKFFVRELRSGIRPIGQEDLVSPVDGKVLYYGAVEDGRIGQVKGVDFELEDFLGPNLPMLREEFRTRDEEGNKHDLLFMTIYLAPGDYHGFHSPASWLATAHRHFPGYLFPVAPWAAQQIKGLFALNERVAVTGRWEHGFFSMTPVGATNVGSITLKFTNVRTNRKSDTEAAAEAMYYREKIYGDDQLVPFRKGDRFGLFHMGSTVVLVFEAPKDFRFLVQEGQKLKLGEPIGVIKKPSTTKTNKKEKRDGA